ncbi:hypothetical protein [Thalassotalea sp. PS06]|uniref:hypothetical protein n=1 Tax=Thalassotalea sp. PS06 TaxID=2594005 RepID=UPI001165320A|nr:hypothetical protein [Thalassotalea sp. PS06]QDP02291.1 hypothetical protein FNC98_13635 [Thalassotalea sp. PS06]
MNIYMEQQRLLVLQVSGGLGVGDLRALNEADNLIDYEHLYPDGRQEKFIPVKGYYQFYEDL